VRDDREAGKGIVVPVQSVGVELEDESGHVLGRSEGSGTATGGHLVEELVSLWLQVDLATLWRRRRVGIG
jgi:hypothetical protein